MKLYAKAILGAAFLCSLLQAQTITLSTASPVYPGATINLTASLSGSAGKNIDGLGFTLPAGSISPVAAAASTAATKTLWSSANGNLLLIGFTNPAPPSQPVITNAAYADGPVATFAYAVPATAIVGAPLSLSLTNLAAVNPTGTAVPLSGVPFTANVAFAPNCLTAITANVSSYLANPSITILGQIVSELVSANGTGVCQ